MSWFILPSNQFFTDAGAPLASGKIHFYAAGTVADQNSYSDIALTSANTNPVVLDGNGRTGPIYLDDSLSYKMKLVTSADVEVWTKDNIKGGALVDDSFVTPLQYGALGDGVADESSSVQTAMDNANGSVDLLGKTYKCDTDIYLTPSHNDLVIRGPGTLEFSDADGLSILGTRGDALVLTVNAAIGDTQINIPSATLAVGDYLEITATTDFSVTDKQSEIVRVKTIDSGSLITLEARIKGAYVTADTAAAHLMGFAKNIVVQDVTLDATSSANWCSIIKYCQNIKFLRCTFVDTPSTHLVIDRVALDCTVYDCTFEDSTLYGVATYGPHDGTLIDRCSFSNAETPIAIGVKTTTSGQCYNTVVSNNRIHGSDDWGIFVGQSEVEPYIFNNRLSGPTGATGLDGIRIQSAGVVLKDNVIAKSFDNAINLDITCTARTSGPYVLSGNKIDTPVLDGINIGSSSGITAERILIENNIIESAGDNGIELAFTSATIADLTIDGNIINTPGADCVDLTTGASDVITNLSVRGNTFDTPTSNCLHMTSTSGSINRLVVSGNTLVSGNMSATSVGVAGDDLAIVSDNVVSGGLIGIAWDNVVIEGNSVKNTGACISMGSGSKCTITGNSLESASSIGAIALTSIGFFAITGNTILNTGAASSGIVAATILDAVITGNVISFGATTTGYGVHLQSGTQSCSSVVVSGNTIARSTADGTGAGAQSVRVDINGTYTLHKLVVAGNGFTNPTSECLYFAGKVEQTSITGNVMTTPSTSASVIWLNGTSANDINDLIINGNTLEGGDYAVELTNSETTAPHIGILGNMMGNYNQANATTPNTFAAPGVYTNNVKY